MRLAIAAYQNRIASILDSADRLFLLESPVQVHAQPQIIQINQPSNDALLDLLRQQGVATLICGAVSGWTQHFLEANGIQVCCWMTGEMNGIIEALATENLYSPRFLMPGCGGRFRHRQGHATQFSPKSTQRGEKMIIGITANGTDLNAAIDPRFGRAQYFIILNSETMGFEAVPNVALQAAHGAGIQAAQLMHDKGVTHLITGSVGPNAMQTLSAGNIQIFEAGSGTVETAVSALQNNELREITQAGPAHAGTGSNPTNSYGMAGGRGMGGGRGRGRN